MISIPAGAQTQAPPAPAPASQTPDEAAIEKALSADSAAKAKSQPAAAAPDTTAQGGQPANALARFFQTMNPDISAIVDFAGGYYSDPSVPKSGDDPAHTGFNVQELEVALQSIVDPYFRADVFLTIPNLGGLEVEEAVLTTTGLPGNLQIRAGIFRADIGRNNTQHLHMQYFTRRPDTNTAFLGIDGLRSPGLEVNWLVPRIPFYLLLSVSAFSVEAAEANVQLQTFGGGKPYDFTYLATARTFFDLSESTSLYLGLHYAHGKTSQSTTTNVALPSALVTTSDPAPTAYDNYYDNLYAGDLYLKWKPPNEAHTYSSLMWTTEYYLRQIPDLKLGGKPHPQLEGGIYSDLVWQAARRWYLGVRGQILGLPSGDNVQREYGAAASVTWALSEFSRVRLYGEVNFPRASGQPVNGAAFVQLEASIGAHGAHPF